MTKEERSWILYDWANSAYSIIVLTAVFPIFFKSYGASGLKENIATAYLGYANTIISLLVAVMAPILGTIADYKGNKKRFLFIFFVLGIISSLMLSFMYEGGWLYGLIIFATGTIGFAGANIFYDSLLVDVAKNKRMDWVSSNGYAWGYIGSCIPFIISIAVILLMPRFMGERYKVIATRSAFLIVAIWWGLFSIPLFRNVKQIYFVEKNKHFIKESFKRLGTTFAHIREYKEVFLFLLEGVNK